MAKEKSYRELKVELDELMNNFESSSHDDVELMLKDFDAANKIIAEMKTRLKKAEQELKQSAKD